MMTIDLEALGFTQGELQERVVSKICDYYLATTATDDDDETCAVPTALSRALRTQVTEAIKEGVAAAVEKHVLPQVQQRIEDLTLQETNRWGEIQPAKTYTFIEFLIKCADNYMMEKVDYDGKGKKETGSYSWKGTQTRLAHMIHKHLHYSIEHAMQAAMKEANAQLVEGITETCKLKLTEIVDKLKLHATIK